MNNLKRRSFMKNTSVLGVGVAFPLLVSGLVQADETYYTDCQKVNFIKFIRTGDRCWHRYECVGGFYCDIWEWACGGGSDCTGGNFERTES